MAVIRTVAAPLRHELDKVKGSRFLATLAPVADREAAAAFVQARRDEHRDASHHCFAWRLGRDPEARRTSDDGEPSGTAGRPILHEIDGRRLTDVVVVVTRWFGGTKLGTGGLARAYAAAAGEALDRARIVERRVTTPLDVVYAYDLTGPVQGVLAAFDLEPESADYGAEVRQRLAVPVEHLDAVRRALVDATTGRIRLDPEASRPAAKTPYTRRHE